MTRAPRGVRGRLGFPTRLEIRIAFRYLRSRRTSWLASLATFIAVGGVAVGVMALIVILGVMNGLTNDLRDRILIGSPHLRVLTLEEYRRLIRDPIRAHLLKTGLTDRIDLVAFSADFPYGVNIASLIGDSKDPQMQHKVGSLTGMLYLDRVVEAGGLDFMNLQGRANKYFRREGRAKTPKPGWEECTLGCYVPVRFQPTDFGEHPYGRSG